MPARKDLSSILIIGSGPIVIGQACEFDYSGTQACRVLREEGYRVILVNSNPATIMTDPAFADATYVEPLNRETLEVILEKERPDAVLPTLGGQTALNLAMELEEAGVFARLDIELIGAERDAIETAEDREKFKVAMQEIGLSVPRSGVARDLAGAKKIATEIGLPVIVRPAFILGGHGTGIAEDDESFARIATEGLAASPISEILIEASIKGWKEYELEVMRDKNDNCVVVCAIENFDPMGTHTGDSITVAPQQTLSDPEYQKMRDAAFQCLRRVGVETGGSNVQFAVDPKTGEQVVIEMNPRVSRSSALASKATGFPIAKIAAQLAVGYTLDELKSDVTEVTPASFEPALDYVVTKIPRWAFEKFPRTSGELGTRMQSVGEVMALGRTFQESLQKACRGLERGHLGLEFRLFEDLKDDELLNLAAVSTPARIHQVAELCYRGVPLDDVFSATEIDPWFLHQLDALARAAKDLEGKSLASLEDFRWQQLKQMGFSDAQIARATGCALDEVRAARAAKGVLPTFKTVDTCAAEFAAETPYHYSTWEDEDEVRPSAREKIVILGSGPNRIGQGIEFDYCCVHASFALREAGFETVMLNCNPETVSTDYDTSDRLYFEPLTLEDVENVLAAEKPRGVIVSLGGQTPLGLAEELDPALILGTSPRSIALAEDREQWAVTCNKLAIPQPAGGTATTLDEARAVAERVGFPALLRPSFVLGGRAMEIVYTADELDAAWSTLLVGITPSATRPVLIDRFLEAAIEVDADAIRDHTGAVLIGGVMEHVEWAGVHSGDSACLLPPATLGARTVQLIEKYTRQIADALEVVGPLNVQYAVKDGQVFVIEANPRASRTLPFVAKATSRPLAKWAARVIAGASFEDLEVDVGADWRPAHYAAKEAVLPFDRFPDNDVILGPEMRSTGEVMGIGDTPGLAFLKSQEAAGVEVASIPASGVFLSLADRDKARGPELAEALVSLGCTLYGTAGTRAALGRAGFDVELVDKLGQGARSAVDLIDEGALKLVVNTPRGTGPRADGKYIRQAASRARVPLVTTLAGALALARGLKDRAGAKLAVRTLQSLK